MSLEAMGTKVDFGSIDVTFRDFSFARIGLEVPFLILVQTDSDVLVVVDVRRDQEAPPLYDSIGFECRSFFGSNHCDFDQKWSFLEG
jgi:hypothetical protein